MKVNVNVFTKTMRIMWGKECVSKPYCSTISQYMQLSNNNVVTINMHHVYVNFNSVKPKKDIFSVKYPISSLTISALHKTIKTTV